MEFGNPSARTVLIQPFGEGDPPLPENEYSLLREYAREDFCLAAFRVGDWNASLSPWPSPAVFGSEGFAGRAADTLREILAFCAGGDKEYYIGGYSLAGLFALWAAYRTGVFRGVAAASPSLWYPGFLDYMASHELKTRHVYLSLGDREAKTRHPVLASVGDNIRAAAALLERQRTDFTLVWNAGNHFREPGRRTARAFAWLLERKD